MVNIAQNYAMMLERLRSNGLSNEKILSILEKEDVARLSQYGNGMPNWETLIEFYKNNKEVLISALTEGYKVTFLTKGVLKRLLELKYGLVEIGDYIDTGAGLDELLISENDLNSLKSIISNNWKIIEKAKENNDGKYLVKIELAVTI